MPSDLPASVEGLRVAIVTGIECKLPDLLWSPEFQENKAYHRHERGDNSRKFHSQVTGHYKAGHRVTEACHQRCRPNFNRTSEAGDRY